jgi:hypothetical protein
MSPTQKQTYFVYNEGYDETLLRLGSLALDYANPRLRRPHIHAKEVYVRRRKSLGVLCQYMTSNRLIFILIQGARMV